MGEREGGREMSWLLRIWRGEERRGEGGFLGSGKGEGGGITWNERRNRFNE